MIRVCHPYTDWEDWAAGMYGSPPKGALRQLGRAADLLSDVQAFYVAASEMVMAWPVAAEQNLSNVSRNRRAWVGQAACCYAVGVPESVTKLAWHTMTRGARDRANRIADDVIADWGATREYRQATLGA